jgi:hypothetical protein
VTSLQELHDIAYALEEIAEVVGVFAVVSPRPPAPTVYVQIAHEGRSLTVTRSHYAIRRQTGAPRRRASRSWKSSRRAPGCARWS